MTDYTSVDSTQPVDSTRPVEHGDTADMRPPTLPPPPPRRRRRPPMIVLVLLVALIAAAVAYPAGRRAAEQQATAPASQVEDAPAQEDAPAVLDAPSPVPEIARTVLPSVAQVELGQGSGSAVIYRADGYVVTNNHVVAQADSNVQVILADGRRRDAEVVGTAPFTDLAVLKIDEQDLPAATFSSAIPEIGSTAVAIGSPFGLDATVTAGVISGTDRELQGGGESLGGLIQTDAAINPGNSGGALADDHGRVIGINTAILSGSGTNAGVGFAIPATSVTAVADQLIETGEVRPGFLGINGQDVSPEAAEAFGVPEGAVIVEVVPASAADEAGLQAEDVIVALDGEPIDSMLGLSSRILVHQPGDEVTIRFVRDGQEREATVTLGKRTDELN
ncbi:MAG TPA: trypsin-like peptidase domain-containing protein [Euzebyales bacterium]|nr:trypsin-like peptidase domain-containing protein [Euzebyales bacterium]